MKRTLKNNTNEINFNPMKKRKNGSIQPLGFPCLPIVITKGTVNIPLVGRQPYPDNKEINK